MIESHPGVPLEKHLIAVKSRIEQYADELKNIEELKRTAQFAGILHDFGKATVYFQKHLKGEKVKKQLSSHSMLSAILSQLICKSKISEKLLGALYLSIKCHHSNPDDFFEELPTSLDWDIIHAQYASLNKEYLNGLLKKFKIHFELPENLPKNFVEFAVSYLYHLKNFTSGTLKNYIFTNLILGMLVDADIRGVIGIEANAKRYEIPVNIVDHFLQSKSLKGINKLRKSFYDTVIKNIEELNEFDKILTITGPTGIGKTLTGFSAALRLRKIKSSSSRIIYVLPFINLIEQNYEVIKQVLSLLPQSSEDLIIKSHYKADPFEHLDKEIVSPEEYEKVFTRLDTWDSEIIVTTFVQFFETIFTRRRANMRRLHRLIGSVVILDEVQNIPITLWETTRSMIEELLGKWDTSFIFMTATQPAITDEAVELTRPQTKVFFENLSRTKIKIYRQAVPYKKIKDWLLPNIKSSKNFLVILNTIRSAQDVFYLLKEELKGFPIIFLSASVIPVDRKKRINEIKKLLEANKRFGVVSTQVVEAGMDIDFSVVIRDFAPLDSIVQAAGRCNRHQRIDEGILHLVELKEAEHERRIYSYIYDSILIQEVRNQLKGRDEIPESNFLEIVEEYFKELKIKSKQTNMTNFLISLSYREIEKNFILFDNVECAMKPVFIEIDDNASKLVNSLNEIANFNASSYEESMKLRLEYRKIKPYLWDYIVNVPSKIVDENFIGSYLPGFKNIWLLSKDNSEFENFYNKETGFVRSVRHNTIML